jgi:dUTP pyrophosphatase
MKKYGYIEQGQLAAQHSTPIATLVNIKKLNPNATLPTQGSAEAAGWDLYACIDEPVCIPPSCTVKIGTGLAFELPPFTFGAIFPRSGLATKKGLRPANCVGVCDSDYRGEYIVAVHNDSESVQWVEPGERIAQLILMPYIPMFFNEVDELTETKRGADGFGSTGK